MPSIQFIYAWHDGNGNRYEQYVEWAAKIIDRIDWSLDNTTNYDQHYNFSCRTGYDQNTYAGYARALVVPEKIEAGNLTAGTEMGVVEADLKAAGYNDPNRWYFVFQDFSGNSAAWANCLTAGGIHPTNNNLCFGVTEAWDSGIAGHELLHLMGAPHAWSKEDGGAYNADIMTGWWDYWMLDQDFNTYYDPSELTATFFTDGNPTNTDKWNVAKHPALTVPTAGDIGFSNDLLTAQERTIEQDAPWSSPTGFTASGAGWFQVTPQGSYNGVSSRYYDGRRSLTMNVQSHAESKVAVSRKVGVTAAQRYKFFARATTSTSGNIKLRMTWYNSSNAQLSVSESSLITLNSGWDERSFSAVAPANAATVEVSVVAPSGQNFAYVLDSLQLNHCNNTANVADGCRTSV
jgi:hypothetical protein